jgi:hypothetical protein
MRSRAVNRLAKQQAIKLQERGDAEFEAIKPALKRAMTDEDKIALRNMRPTGDDEWDYGRLYALLRPIADRAGAVQRFDKVWQLLLKVEKLNGE